ncbi:hypothetical protein [uncultured Azohydromonas sp.]|jgi:hypothetical protein|uniref:hypothetical protein n=1 Tax=uncultured Azohydromonas sp. TaxID=487342 RepID=UPI002601753C|nr:hypothetical protein [uncultured Azohydromonas sp.]
MKIEPKDLTREKTLLSLYVLSFKFPGSWFNRVLTLVALLCAAFWCWHTRSDPGKIFSHFRKVVDADFAFATSILGFLVAGFTVFVTITKVDIFVEMAKQEYENTGESYLKYNLNAFVLTFVHYIAFLFFCLCIQLFGQPGGLAAYLLERIAEEWFYSKSNVRALVASVLLTFITAWSVYVVLLLKSFIYNTYQVVTTVVRWELEKPPER